MSDEVGGHADMGPRRHRWVWAGAGLAAIAVVGTVLIVVTRLGAPSFPSLVENPDRSLEGAVAYIGPGEGTEWCLHVVSASGEGERQLPVCADPNVHLAEQLLWTGGQVEIVDRGQSAGKPGGSEERAPWHVLVDPVTGATTGLSVTDLPPVPDPATVATSEGRTVRTISKDGDVRMELTDGAGTRTVWTSKGKTSLWEVGQPVWSPDGAWLVAHDGADRLLLFTIAGDTAEARVLVANGARGLFAITTGPLGR